MEQHAVVAIAKTFLTSYSQRAFVAHFGVTPSVCVVLYTFLSAADQSFGVNDLLVALYFLKVYPTEDVGANFFKISRKTYRKKTWSVLSKMYTTLGQLVCFYTTKLFYLFRFLLNQGVKIGNIYPLLL